MARSMVSSAYPHTALSPSFSIGQTERPDADHAAVLALTFSIGRDRRARVIGECGEAAIGMQQDAVSPESVYPLFDLFAHESGRFSAAAF
jgi:hypothetical protein